MSNYTHRDIRRRIRNERRDARFEVKGMLLVTVKVGCPNVAQAGKGLRKKTASSTNHERFAVWAVADKYFGREGGQYTLRQFRTGSQCTRPPTKSLWLVRIKGGAA